MKVTGVNTYDLPVLSNKRMRELFGQMARGEDGTREVLLAYGSTRKKKTFLDGNLFRPAFMKTDALNY